MPWMASLSASDSRGGSGFVKRTTFSCAEFLRFCLFLVRNRLGRRFLGRLGGFRLRVLDSVFEQVVLYCHDTDSLELEERLRKDQELPCPAGFKANGPVICFVSDRS